MDEHSGTTLAGRVTEVRDAYLSGQITREQYWIQMRERHRALRDYAGLVAVSEVNRIEIHSQGLEVVLNDGTRMRWDPEDLRSAPNVMINHGTYEPEESRILSTLGARARTVLDIGANAGLMAIRIARAGSAAVHAFEPVPGTYEELVNNVRRNDLTDRIHCHPVALGETIGEVDFFLPDIHGSVAASARALFPDGQNTRITVGATTLDEFANSHGLEQVDLVKCDVEGAEIFVLRGGLETVGKNRPVLMLELLKKWSSVYGYHPNDVFEMLRPMTYKAFAVQSGRLTEVPEVDEDTVATNFFFFAEHHREELELARHACASA